MTDVVLYEFSDQIATLTLNRPDKLNAISFEVADRILDLLNEIETDSQVRAVIITGAGDKAFSAGADIVQFSRSVAAGTNEALRDFVRRGQTMTARLEAFCKPVIAAVNGLAYGGGCEITEAVHLSVASDHATFAKPEIKLGMPPTFGGTQRLPRLAGRKRAMEFLLTGETFSAHRAWEIGLVNSVVRHDELLKSARSLAERIIRHSPLAVTSVINSATRGINLSIAEGLLVETEQFARMVPTHDLREGLEAWMQRREPCYGGR
ncbi:MAG TPA: crotonase/enoyl-CoA hydratase family protein [Pseudolabrys sp.]|nr:crotonase/enoyl-CoA hydratase family protein [Pseudolabrys sp.]